MKVCFLINDLRLSGGIGVILRHARQLPAHGIDVTLAVTKHRDDEWKYTDQGELNVVAFDDVKDQHFDIAIATWWRTCYQLFDLQADRYAYFVQSLEDRFYSPDNSDRLYAAITHSLPVSFITEGQWIKDALKDLSPESPCYYVRNGIDKEIFNAPEGIQPSYGSPLRILVEGHPDVWFKGVAEACKSLTYMRESYTGTLVNPSEPEHVPDGVHNVVGPLTSPELADVYRNSDVLLKCSRVEGVYNPPLEGFHSGATCVTTAVTGHDEYIQHGFNGLVVDWDDHTGMARSLDLLARNRRYLHYLRSNAIFTARNWPSWTQSSEFMAAALRKIRKDNPPQVGKSIGQLLRDVDLGAREFMRHSPNSYPALRNLNDELNAQLRAQTGELERLRRLRRLIPGLGILRRISRFPLVRPFAKLARSVISR